MIFVDTSFWLALCVPRDSHHGEAVTLMRELASTSLVTSNHVRGESWTIMRRRAWHAAAVKFLDVLERTEQGDEKRPCGPLVIRDDDSQSRAHIAARSRGRTNG